MTENEFIDYEFDPTGTNVNYTNSGATYTTFKTFAIKIVMVSTSTTKVPRIQDMRTIAMAWMNINLLEMIVLRLY